MDGQCRALPQNWAAFDEQLQERTTAEYHRDHPPGTGNPIAMVPGWTLQMVRYDETHVLKLGLARLTIGSAMVDLVDQGRWGQPGDWEQLKHAYADFRRWSRENGVHANVRRFTKSRLGVRTDQFPESATKAWNSRLLVKWLAHLLGADETEANQALRLHVVSLNSLFDNMEQCKNLFFSEAEAAQFQADVRMVLATNVFLAQRALERGVLRWPLRPKHHGLHHLSAMTAVDSRNCKYTGCICDEDVLGRLIRVARVVARRGVCWAVVNRCIVRMVRKWRTKPAAVTRRILRPDRFRRRGPPPHWI